MERIENLLEKSLAAGKITGTGNGIWPATEKDFQRTAPAGFGLDRLWPGNARYAGIDFATSARPVAPVCASAVE